MSTLTPGSDTSREFTRFVKEVEPRLSVALAAAYGSEVGAEATEDALVWGWEHWDEVCRMGNPAGYLFRVGQSSARRYQRPSALFPAMPPGDDAVIAPELPDALAGLTRNQRACVVLIHGFGYSEREVADLLHLSRWSVRTHADRGLNHLRSVLEVSVDA